MSEFLRSVLYENSSTIFYLIKYVILYSTFYIYTRVLYIYIIIFTIILYLHIYSYIRRNKHEILIEKNHKVRLIKVQFYI